MPYLQESVAFEYYEILGAVLTRECVSAHKPKTGRSFSLSLPIALPAELSAFVCKHLNEPAFLKLLDEELDLLQMKLSTSTGTRETARTRNYIRINFYCYFILL